MIEKTGVFSVVGRPNVGKSTLTNTLCGAKVAIVSNKPQTTRNRITGVLSQDPYQMVFLDTPGLHKAKNALGDFMVKVVNKTVADVDAAILLVEPVARIGIRCHPPQRPHRRRQAGTAPGAGKAVYALSGPVS